MESSNPVVAGLSGADLEALFTFAVWMHGTREDAAAKIAAIARTAPPKHHDGWLALLWNDGPTSRLRGGAGSRLRALDELLRGEMSVTVAPDHPLVRGEPRRLGVLRSEVKRTCLGAVLAGLTPFLRGVFLLESLFGLTPARIADICGASLVHVQEARRRAMRTLEDYLSIRCEHIDPRNVCSCAGRVGVALERGFIRWPEHGEHDAEHAVRVDTSDLHGLYTSLPRFRPDSDTARRLRQNR